MNDPRKLFGLHALDQDQADAREWFADAMNHSADSRAGLVELAAACESDEPAAIKRLDDELLACVQHLTLLKLRELSAAYIDGKEKLKSS